MPDPILYLSATGSAAVVSAIVVLAMAGSRRNGDLRWLTVACVLAIGAGVTSGCGVLPLRIAWPPLNGLDRFLTIIAPAVLGLELLLGVGSIDPRQAWILRSILAVAVPRVLVHGSVFLAGSESGSENSWTTAEAGVVLLGGGALLAGVWGLLSRLFERSPAISIPFAVVLSMTCAGLTVMMAGYIRGGAAAFLLAASLVATALMSRWIAKRPVAPAIVGIGVVGLFCLLFIGRYFGRLSTGDALAMFLAPLLCWVTELPGLRHRPVWVVESLRFVVVSLPLLLVLVAAKKEFDRKMAPLLGRTREPAVHRFLGTRRPDQAVQLPIAVCRVEQRSMAS